MISDEVREKWVAALRSGEYAQGREMLRDDNMFCCLGVLCEITPEVAHTSVGYLEPESGDDRFAEDLIEELNTSTLDYFGLSSDAQRLLVQLNDERVRSFSEIADVIEKGEGIYKTGDSTACLVKI